MNEPKMNRIGKVVIVEFETSEEAEVFYGAFKRVYEVIREVQEKS